MNTQLIKALAIIMVIMGIVIVPFQVNIVQTLRKNGFNASIFLFLFSDLWKYRKLMKNEKDNDTKNKMKITYCDICNEPNNEVIQATVFNGQHPHNGSTVYKDIDICLSCLKKIKLQLNMELDDIIKI